MALKNYGRAALSEVLADRVVYRSLEPADARLPGLERLRPGLDLLPGAIPRKSEPDYARVVAAILAQAQRQRGVAAPLRRLLFVGDTRLLDGSAFANLCQAGGWPGLAFIGAEDSHPAVVDLVPGPAQTGLYLANRWAALPAFAVYARAHGLPVDEATAVVVDIDKTFLGARGRNGQVIDQARVQAVAATVAAALGEAFDPPAFQAAYDRLNQPEFHPFTTDNQDYLAYLCLLLGSGFLALDTITAQIRQGAWSSFAAFMAAVDRRSQDLPPALADLHREVYSRVQAGDPTPFKTFRRTEYRCTLARLGALGEDTPLARLLAEEIVITQEVRAAALAWQAQGALVFGLSDKPDEAAIPTPELAAQGWLPIHRAETHAVGAAAPEWVI